MTSHARNAQPGAAARHPFHTLLVEQTPALRVLARMLTRNEARAQDLVQDTLIKAWAARDRYHPDTRLRAWLCTIMRNTWYSEMRKRRREVEDVDDLLAARLWVPPAQEHASALREFQAALATLPASQREAIVLVGGAGFTQEEAAEICGCAVGTVKSRVNRARTRLTVLLRLGAADAGGADSGGADPAPGAREPEADKPGAAAAAMPPPKSRAD